jgi:hypothetical protein
MDNDTRFSAPLADQAGDRAQRPLYKFRREGVVLRPVAIEAIIGKTKLGIFMQNNRVSVVEAQHGSAICTGCNCRSELEALSCENGNRRSRFYSLYITGDALENPVRESSECERIRANPGGPR